MGESAAVEAEDCTQDIMVAVLAALPRFEYGHGKFLSWVFGIAAHKVADLHRRRSSGRERLVPSVEAEHVSAVRLAPAASEEYVRLEEDRRVGRVLRRLPEPYRDVLALRLAFGYSAEETAEILEMPSAGAVRVAQHRALHRLRQLVHVDS